MVVVDATSMVRSIVSTTDYPGCDVLRPVERRGREEREERRGEKRKEKRRGWKSRKGRVVTFPL